MSQKQIMIGLSSYNGRKESNTSWENSLNQPIVLTEGDSVAVRNVFLDTRTQSTNSIIIPTDTTISLDYYFYYMNRGGNQQPSPFDVSLNVPGFPPPPQVVQTGMFDFLNPLNYTINNSNGSIAPQLIPPTSIPVISFNRSNDITTVTLAPSSKSIPLSAVVSIVQTSYDTPPVVTFDATNVTISEITYAGGSTTFNYSNIGPDESTDGTVTNTVGLVYTQEKLLPTASCPNLGNIAPLVESVMYPDFYGGFSGKPIVETGVNENPAAMVPSTNYTAFIDYNNVENNGITKVEKGWTVTALDTSQVHTGINIQESPNTQTEGDSYPSLFQPGNYPDIFNVAVGNLVTFPGFTGTTPQLVSSIVSAPDTTQVQVVIVLDLSNNNPHTSLTIYCETPQVAPFPGDGGFIVPDTSALYITLNQTQVTFDASDTQSGQDQGAGNTDTGTEYFFLGLIADFPNYTNINSTYFSTYTGDSGSPHQIVTGAAAVPITPTNVVGYKLDGTTNVFDVYLLDQVPSIGAVYVNGTAEDRYRFFASTAILGYYPIEFYALILPSEQFGGLENIPFTIANCNFQATISDGSVVQGQLFTDILIDQIPNLGECIILVTSIATGGTTEPVMNEYFTIFIPNSTTIAPNSTVTNVTGGLTITIDQPVVYQGPNSYYLLLNCYDNFTAQFLNPDPTQFTVGVMTNDVTTSGEIFTFLGGYVQFNTFGNDPTREDYSPIAIGYDVNIQSGAATGTISQINIDQFSPQFVTNIVYYLPPSDYTVVFSTTTGDFYPPNTTMVNYNQATQFMTMSNFASAKICGGFYYEFLPPDLILTIQNQSYIIISYNATQTIYVQDLLFTFTPPGAYLNSVVQSTAYITTPDTAYAITFPTLSASIPTPNDLPITFTQDRPAFSNLSNLNNFGIPMDITSGDGLPYLAYMNLSQVDNQGNPTGICDPTARVPIRKRWKMLLKAGSYAPDRLSQLLTRNMSIQKNKIQRNYWENTAMAMAITPSDGINKEYLGLPSKLEPYNPAPDNIPVAVPDFLLDNFQGYLNGALTDGFPTSKYNPSRAYLAKNPKAYPQNSDVPLTTAKLAGLSPDYESQSIFDDDDQPFLFRPTAYAKPNPLAVTVPDIVLDATQGFTDLNTNGNIPNPADNPMTSNQPFTCYFPSFVTTPMNTSGQTQYALYTIPLYGLTSTSELYQLTVLDMSQYGITSESDVQFLLVFRVVWPGMDANLPAPFISTAAWNEGTQQSYFTFNFNWNGTPPTYQSIFSFIYPQTLPLTQITEDWQATRQNLGTTNPGAAEKVLSNSFNNSIYSYEITFQGDETIGDTTSLQVIFNLPGSSGDINQRESYLYTAGMCYNDINLFKWNGMQQNLSTPPALVDVYFGPFLTDCYSPFFQQKIKDTGMLEKNELTNYYAIRPVITQQMEYNIHEHVSLIEQSGNPGTYDVSSNMYFTYAPNYEVVCPLVGASEISLTYNAENNGIFQFQYMHTPLYTKVEGSSAVTEAVGLYPSLLYQTGSAILEELATPAQGTFTADKQSGIILAAMEPKWFWNLLGFDTSGCVANPPANDTGASFMTFEEFQEKTTGGFNGSANNFDTAINMVGDSLQCYAATPDLYSLSSAVDLGSNSSANVSYPFFVNKYNVLPTFYEVQTTNTLNALSIPLASDAAGYWLVEIQGYQSEFMTDNEKMDIKAIVSNYFNNGGAFSTTNGQDDYSYHHSGQPIMLSNLKIRILNPVTMLEDLTLGPNNSVYLQVTKYIPQPNYEPVNTDSNTQVPWSSGPPPPPQIPPQGTPVNVKGKRRPMRETN